MIQLCTFVYHIALKVLLIWKLKFISNASHHFLLTNLSPYLNINISHKLHINGNFKIESNIHSKVALKKNQSN